MPQAIATHPLSTTLLLAMELSRNTWVLGFSNGSARCILRTDARDLRQFWQAVEVAAKRLEMPPGFKLLACYEAGRDGFSISRMLRKAGHECWVVDSASIETSRRRRKVKTDNIDVRKLLSLLYRRVGGEKEALRIVCEPSVDEEDARERSRELDRVKKLLQAEQSSIRCLLVKHGIQLQTHEIHAELAECLDGFRTLAGAELGSTLKARIRRALDRVTQLQKQRRGLEQERRKQLASEDPSVVVGLAQQLMTLKGIGHESAWLLAHELFGHHKFRNRREVAAIAGLTPTPWASGASNREQGIAKAGNGRVRSLMVELSWLWLRHQPDSEISRWFNERWATNGRSRRIGIVAVARKLLVALWRYVEHGVVPPGAVLKDQAAAKAA